MAGASVASKKAKAKGNAGRKVKDKWKSKEWYTIHAPAMFNEAPVGETPANEPETLIGRTTEVTVQDLTGDFSKMHIKLKFKISGYDGHEAQSVFVGHELTSDYVRRLTRRKKTKTDHVIDFETKDGYLFRIKTMSIAERRVQSSQEIAMRQIIAATLKQMGAEMTIAEIVKQILSGDLSKALAKACHVIIPIKRIEIRKSEVLAQGEASTECIIDVQKDEPAEAVEEVAEEATEEVVEEAAAEETTE